MAQQTTTKASRVSSPGGGQVGGLGKETTVCKATSSGAPQCRVCSTIVSRSMFSEDCETKTPAGVVVARVATRPRSAKSFPCRCCCGGHSSASDETLCDGDENLSRQLGSSREKKRGDCQTTQGDIGGSTLRAAVYEEEKAISKLQRDLQMVSSISRSPSRQKIVSRISSAAGAPYTCLQIIFF